MSDVAEREPGLKVAVGGDVDWGEVARLVTTSRALDELEETRLVPEKKVLYQFSARGHDLAQVLLGCNCAMAMRPAVIIDRGRCCWRWASTLADALGSGMGREGGYSDGRDIGVVFNYPNPGGAHALADVRRGRGAICAGGGLGAGGDLQGARAG